MIPTKSFTVLVADDDEEDRLLLEEAFTQNGLFGCGKFVANGDEAMEYLLNSIGADAIHPVPSLIMLDLHMPMRNGLDTLQTIRSNRHLKNIPVLILTSSRQEVEKAYQLGVNSYLVKPQHFNELIRMVGEVTTYWRYTVSLPTDQE